MLEDESVDRESVYEVTLDNEPRHDEKDWWSQGDSSWRRSAYNELDGCNDDSNVQVFQVRVSSKHLSVSSIVFRTMLSKKFEEGDALCSKGITEVALPDDHPLAFLVILHLLHSRMRSVPRAVDQDLLTEMAVLVDKYRLHDALSFHSDMWIDGLKQEIPATLGEDLYKWICVTWVFSKATEFKRATQVAQRQAVSRLDDLPIDLPIPNTVIGENHLIIICIT